MTKTFLLTFVLSIAAGAASSQDAKAVLEKAQKAIGDVRSNNLQWVPAMGGRNGTNQPARGM